MHTLKMILVLLFVIGIYNANAQEDKTARPSPPAETTGRIDSADIEIQYNSPAVKGREIWGSLVPFGKVWRTGANEATVFETDEDLIIGEQTLPQGKYGLFTIPGETEWIIIFNSVWDQWGSFRYDESKDVLRVTVKPEQIDSFNERLNLNIENDHLVIRWEKLQVSCPLRV